MFTHDTIVALKPVPQQLQEIKTQLDSVLANTGNGFAASPVRDEDAVPLLAFVERHKLFARDIFHLEQPLGPRKRATHGVAARSSAF